MLPSGPEHPASISASSCYAEAHLSLYQLLLRAIGEVPISEYLLSDTNFMSYLRSPEAAFQLLYGSGALTEFTDDVRVCKRWLSLQESNGASNDRPC